MSSCLFSPPVLFPDDYLVKDEFEKIDYYQLLRLQRYLARWGQILGEATDYSRAASRGASIGNLMSAFLAILAIMLELKNEILENSNNDHELFLIAFEACMTMIVILNLSSYFGKHIGQMIYRRSEDYVNRCEVALAEVGISINTVIVHNPTLFKKNLYVLHDIVETKINIANVLPIVKQRAMQMYRESDTVQADALEWRGRDNIINDAAEERIPLLQSGTP